MEFIAVAGLAVFLLWRWRRKRGARSAQEMADRMNRDFRERIEKEETEMRSRPAKEMSEREIASMMAQHAGNRAAEFKGQIIMAIQKGGPQIQSQLIKEIAQGDDEDRMLFYAASAELAEQGRIIKEKKGRSYVLRLAE
ncbi:MAG: hypothetical protein AB7U46_11230 [Paenirhodobacter sp.]|uniref:hypothetical protein n=1 Tax=Paenirhodobacter sp. TaxID=1965326 RepID=UPI003D09BA0A